MITSKDFTGLQWPVEIKNMILVYQPFAVYGPLAWNCLPKEIGLCDEIEAFKRNLKTHLFVKFVNESTLAIWFWRVIVKRPGMLSAQFVALYKPCKPKPNINHIKREGIVPGIDLFSIDYKRVLVLDSLTMLVQATFQIATVK